MAFVHGKDSVVFGDSAAWTGYLNQYTASRSRQAVASTTFGNDDQTFVAGLGEGSLSIGGNFDASTIDADLEGLIAAGVNPVTVGFGTAIGARAFLFDGHLDDYSAQGPVNDLVRVSASFAGSGAVRFGVNLHALEAETSTGAFGSVDQTAQSTNGGVAQVHVTAFSGTNVTLAIEDSANDADWANVATFTSITGTGSERITFTGNVDQYVRANITAGTFSSITFTVALARNWD